MAGRGRFDVECLEPLRKSIGMAPTVVVGRAIAQDHVGMYVVGR